MRANLVYLIFPTTHTKDTFCQYVFLSVKCTRRRALHNLVFSRSGFRFPCGIFLPKVCRIWNLWWIFFLHSPYCVILLNPIENITEKKTFYILFAQTKLPHHISDGYDKRWRAILESHEKNPMIIANVRMTIILTVRQMVMVTTLWWVKASLI